jgi:hypothetical protein
MHAGGKLLAELADAGANFLLRGRDGLHVLLADLLFDEGAGDQLLQRVLPGDRAAPTGIRIEDGEANLVVEIAGKDGLPVDDGDDAVENHGGRTKR